MQADFDPVSLEIMWNRLIHIAEECWITIWRTAFSTIIGDAQDFGCEILDASGNSLAHSARSMPVFNLSLPLTVRTLLARFPVETLQPGDVLVTNDPWICAGHLFDVATVTPVFRGGRVVALIGSIGHCSDLGGTKDSLTAREVYEEGVQIPPLKLFRAGTANEDLLAMIAANVRKPEMVLGDIHAQVSANAVGAERLLAFMDEYGLDDLTALAVTIQDRAEQAMRKAVARIPDGVYAHEVWSDGQGGEPLRLPVRLSVSGSEITVDYAGAPPQAERGGINCTLNYTASHSVYALKCVLTPDIPSNAGCYRPIHVRAPEGSILNCRYPASVNVRTKTGWYCASAIFGALVRALPDRVKAHTAQPLGVGAYGYDARGRLFNDHLLQGGGAGAWLGHDGQSALLFPTSAANVSVEMFETRTPAVVASKEFVPDSGGPGRWRGGLGQRLLLRKLYDDRQPVLVGVQPEGVTAATPGLCGGRHGAPARVSVLAGGRPDQPLPESGTVVLRRTDEAIRIELGGGSGYGDPLDRDPAAVARDVRLGLVTAEGARRDYGVLLDGDGGVDAAATARARQGRRPAPVAPAGM